MKKLFTVLFATSLAFACTKKQDETPPAFEESNLGAAADELPPDINANPDSVPPPEDDGNPDASAGEEIPAK